MLDDWLGRRRDGRWSYLTNGLTVPRQNGKNALLEIRELFGTVALGEKFLHTAHEVKTARKAFVRLASFFDNARRYPELATLVKEIRRTNGQEAIVLDNGGSVEFIARSKNSGRGFTVDVLAMDEAQELTDDALEALIPTTSSAPLRNPQWIFTGTPPGPSASGEVFTRVRDDALAGKERRLCWHEWSVEGDDVDLDDRALWFEVNPGLSARRLQIDVVEGERTRFSDDGFARERLGMWASLSHTAVIDPHVWAALADRHSVVQDPVAFAVDVAPDRRTASFAVAGYRADGLLHIEVPRSDYGTDWVVDYVVEKTERNHPCAVVVEGSGPAGSLIPDLERAGVAVESASTQKMGQACGAFYDAVTQDRLRHINSTILNAALGAARRRTVGDGAWTWHRKDTAADITPLVASTLALYGFLANPPPVKHDYAVAGF